MIDHSWAHSLLLLGSALPDPYRHPLLPGLHTMSGVRQALTRISVKIKQKVI